MVSDFVSNVPCLSKKKRTNRLAKLKQSKLDVRREQWLSQVKNKECKVDLNGGGESSPFSTKQAVGQNKSLHHLDTKVGEEENEAVSLHDSDLESLINRPINHNDSIEVHCGSDLKSLINCPINQNDSTEVHCGSSYSGSSTRSESIEAHCGRSYSGSSARSDCCSGSVSEEEEDGCIDNWEDIADALSIDDNQHNRATTTVVSYEIRIEATCADQRVKNQGTNLSNCVSHMNCRAWRPDDAFCPRSLPSLSKEHNISLNSDWHNGHGAFPRAQPSTMSHASSCPICCEDLDVTDSSFLPCPCRFRLCLFCHKKILEMDGRCPGCRKHYDTTNVNICFSR